MIGFIIDFIVGMIIGILTLFIICCCIVSGDHDEDC